MQLIQGILAQGGLLVGNIVDDGNFLPLEGIGGLALLSGEYLVSGFVFTPLGVNFTVNEKTRQ